ncbi:hypothetical protein EO087_11675 [Dyella sp. M7H15-1]|uniref:hypothetical protein n=1 Tax=Dyella sp. M7H15-1 TaxID=2501295 RepID=UPI00100507F2|nr:hypothetical protein [Dyella sp. M7H15-1]QAU24565.1 hypothetical protein EO087_11675 [Dyella sp. M7H15-1]
MTSEEMDAREEFENCFLHFVQALQVLSHDADTQCEEMGNYNTPWEIQRDTAGSGLGSLRLSAPYLSWGQAEKIVDLVAALRRLPKEALSVPVPHMKMIGHAGCITAMNHPAWEPLRKEATQLLVLLEPAIKRNEAYFQEQ